MGIRESKGIRAALGKGTRIRAAFEVVKVIGVAVGKGMGVGRSVLA